jgi:hypothetical protein
MSTTTTPDEPRPVRITADVGRYLDAIQRATLETLMAAGLSAAEAADWLVKAKADPTSEEAMRFYRRRYVLGEHELPTADEVRASRDNGWIAPERIDALADFVEDAERSAWRQDFLDHWRTSEPEPRGPLDQPLPEQDDDRA